MALLHTGNHSPASARTRPLRERFGYFFHASTYTPPLGHASVDVFLADSEDGWFFPTRTATFPVADDDGISHLHVSQTWAFGQQDFRLAPGMFFLVAWDGDLVEGFSFGGDLAIDQQDDHISCHLRSPAPFFDLADTSGLVAILVPEFEAELGRLRAEWQGTDDEFDRRVAAADPLALFVASMRLSNDYTHRLPALNSDEFVLDERHIVSHAVHILMRADEWPDEPATLHQLIFDE
ncbi:MAG: hypothetical protein R2844_14105 [Caldilineales bacterium]